MDLKVFLAAASSVVGIACFIPYIRDVFRRKTKPHNYSWLIWTLLQSIAVVAMLGGGAGIGVASLAIGAMLCAFVFFLSLRYGTSNITVFDKICLAGALLATVVYVFLQDAFLSVLVVTFTDLIGFLPTFRKAYEEPYTETPSTYALSSLSSLLALGALASFTFTTSIYLTTLVITNATCALVIVRRR
jgi:hypothetical protein